MNTLCQTRARMGCDLAAFFFFSSVYYPEGHKVHWDLRDRRELELGAGFGRGWTCVMLHIFSLRTAVGSVTSISTSNVRVFHLIRTARFDGPVPNRSPNLPSSDGLLPGIPGAGGRFLSPDLVSPGGVGSSTSVGTASSSTSIGAGPSSAPPRNRMEHFACADSGNHPPIGEI